MTACDTQIGIAQEEIQDDTYDSIQDSSENNEAEEPEGTDEQQEPEESGDPEIEDQEESEEETPEEITDFLQRGPYEVTDESRTASVTNCTNMNYSVYSPSGIMNPPVVVLGHGFARGADTMTGWADHLSSWGVEVLLPTLCHYNVFAGVDHEMNGQNMKELAIAHGATEVVYAGHSAGGLAAIIAASQDTGAAGVLGLDATDTEGIPGVPDLIGQQYAEFVTCPAFSIMGESSTCNASNNGLELFRMMDESQVFKIASADHCDFESPTDWICESQCENPTVEFSDEEINPAVTVLGTAAVMALTGLSADGPLIWSGTGIESWIDSGLVQGVE